MYQIIFLINEYWGNVLEYQPIGIMVRVFANGLGDWHSSNRTKDAKNSI